MFILVLHVGQTGCVCSSVWHYLTLFISASVWTGRPFTQEAWDVLLMHISSFAAWHLAHFYHCKRAILSKNWKQPVARLWTSYEHFTTVLMSVWVEIVTDMKRIHTAGVGHFLSCALSFFHFVSLAPSRSIFTSYICVCVCVCVCACVCKDIFVFVLTFAAVPSRGAASASCCLRVLFFCVCWRRTVYTLAAL